MSRDTMLSSTADAIGNTPLVRLNHVTKGLQATIAVKLEYMNPAGSVKDRIAFNMIEKGEAEGKITPGKTVLIEPTSGNMGIALAFCAAMKGYKLILTMPSSMSVERRALLKAYGAEVIWNEMKSKIFYTTRHDLRLSCLENLVGMGMGVYDVDWLDEGYNKLVLTDPQFAVRGAIERAQELVKSIPNAFIPNQFANPANPEAHYMTTGPEIWKQTDGKVDIVCFGVGSGGTCTGVGRFLKEKNPNIKVYPVEPYESSVINGLPHSPHKIQGMGIGMIPEVLDRSLFDEALRVHSDDAMAMAKRLAVEESILAGISSGANVCAAIQLAKRPENKGKLIVTTINSCGERYLSSALYKNILDEVVPLDKMSTEESIARAKKYLGI